MKTEDFGKEYATEQIRRSQHPLRKIVKKFYISEILRYVVGPTIDFGCGAGQLLSRLPAGSLGLEINPYLVEFLQFRRTNVALYSPDDQFSLGHVAENYFKTLVMSHVLEHFDNADKVLRKIMQSSNRLGISRLIIVVPSVAGYKSDKTHKTFINKDYLRNNNLENLEGYTCKVQRFFPLDKEIVGKYCTFHELFLVYDRA